MSERNDQLQGLIQDGEMVRAVEMVRSTDDYQEAELFVFTVLDNEKSTPELVRVVLEAFLDMRENWRPKHGYWVHSLSHFTEILWERRMDQWIKKFNEVSFRGANELGDPNCSDRLVHDFAEHAKFDDDPTEFALTPENLRWMDWEYAEYSLARIRAGRFESEADFLIWKLRQPKMQTEFDYDVQAELVDIEGIRSRIQELQELGADTSEFDGLEKDLLAKQLDDLKEKLSVSTEDWQRKRLEKGIQKTLAALGI